jgi:hypothetical protein
VFNYDEVCDLLERKFDLSSLLWLLTYEARESNERASEQVSIATFDRSLTRLIIAVRRAIGTWVKDPSSTASTSGLMYLS